MGRVCDLLRGEVSNVVRHREGPEEWPAWCVSFPPKNGEDHARKR